MTVDDPPEPPTTSKALFAAGAGLIVAGRAWEAYKDTEPATDDVDDQEDVTIVVDEAASVVPERER